MHVREEIKKASHANLIHAPSAFISCVVDVQHVCLEGLWVKNGPLFPVGSKNGSHYGYMVAWRYWASEFRVT